MKLNEVFDAPLPFQLTSDDTGYFNIHGKTYEVYFDPVENDPTAVEMSFRLRKGVNQQGTLDYSTDIEGSGDATIVFSTVIAITRKFISRSPNMTKLVFHSKANEPSRLKLYDRMVSRIQPGWAVSSEMQGNEKVYTLTRPQAQGQAGQTFDDVPF